MNPIWKSRKRWLEAICNLLMTIAAVIVLGLVYLALSIFFVSCSAPSGGVSEQVGRWESERSPTPIPTYSLTHPPTYSPARSQSLVTSAATMPATQWLLWENPETWMVNLVEFKTDLAAPWRTYAWVTNSNEFAVALKLDVTNRFAVFRVACVYFF